MPADTYLTHRQGEIKLVYGTVVAPAGTTLTITGQPRVTVYDGSGAIVNGFNNVATTGNDVGALPAPRAWIPFDTTNGPLAAGFYVFKFNIAAGGATYEPESYLYLEPVPPVLQTSFADLNPQMRLVLAELNQSTSSYLASQIPYIWQYYNEKSYIGPRLQFLHVKRDCINMLLAQNYDQSDWREGDVEYHDNQRSLHLQFMIQEVQGQIDRIYQRAQAVRLPRVGAITVVTPTTPPGGSPDANDTIYRGDPYKRFTPNGRI